jgi:hypothetical protein
MTALSDAQIGHVCRTAGFFGDELTNAVAVAIATSGGCPGYDHPVWPGPVAHYKGLFGVDTVQWPQVAGSELHSPWVAADVAYELTKRYGWGWNATARAGNHHHYLERAMVSANVTPHREQAAEPIMIGRHAHAVRQTFARLQTTMDAIDAGRH